MSNPAFIVDGQQGKKIIQHLCPGAPVRVLNCNGDDVELHAAAKRIASLIRLMGNKYYPYVIIFDRESRWDSPSTIKVKLESLIREEGIGDLLVIGVPDRMIENWILADWENIRAQGRLKHPTRLKTFEGCNGKSTIRKLLPKGGIYQETVQGVSWFLTADVKIIFRQSPSFQALAKGSQQLTCGWLKPCLPAI